MVYFFLIRKLKHRLEILVRKLSLYEYVKEIGCYLISSLISLRYVGMRVEAVQARTFFISIEVIRLFHVHETHVEIHFSKAQITAFQSTHFPESYEFIN